MAQTPNLEATWKLVTALFTTDLCRKTQRDGERGAEGTKGWRKRAGGQRDEC